MLPQGRSELERMVDVDSTPVLGGGILYVAAYQGKVKGLRAADGSLLWEHDVSSHRDLAQGYDQLYVIDDTDVITAYDQRTAQVAWTQDGLYRRGLSSPVVFGNYLVTLDSDGYLHVLSQTDGRFMARQRVDRKGVRSRPAVGSEAVYVLGNSGSLNAFDIRAR